MSGSDEPISGDIQFSDMDVPMPDDSGVGKQLTSEMPDIPGDLDGTTGEPITRDIQLSDMDAPMPDESADGDQSPSEMPDLAGDFDSQTGGPFSGFNGPNTEIIHSLHIYSHGRWDRDSLFLV